MRRKRNHKREPLNVLIILGGFVVGGFVLLTILLAITANAAPKVAQVIVSDPNRAPVQFEMALQMSTMYQSEPTISSLVPPWLIALIFLALVILLLWRGQHMLAGLSGLIRTAKKKTNNVANGREMLVAPTAHTPERTSGDPPRTIHDIEWL